MLARIVLFGLALLGLWLIWRAVRQWNNGNAAPPENAEQERQGRQLPHQRNDGSAPWIAAVGSADGTRSGVRKSEHSREPGTAREVDTPRVDDHMPGADSQPGSGSSDDSGGSGGSD